MGCPAAGVGRCPIAAHPLPRSPVRPMPAGGKGRIPPLGGFQAKAEANITRLTIGHAVQADGAFRGHDVEIIRVRVDRPRLADDRTAGTLGAGGPNHRAEQGELSRAIPATRLAGTGSGTRSGAPAGSMR